jgi:hypothetical protein
MYKYIYTKYRIFLHFLIFSVVFKIMTSIEVLTLTIDCLTVVLLFIKLNEVKHEISMHR